MTDDEGKKDKDLPPPFEAEDIADNDPFAQNPSDGQHPPQGLAAAQNMSEPPLPADSDATAPAKSMAEPPLPSDIAGSSEEKKTEQAPEEPVFTNLPPEDEFGPQTTTPPPAELTGAIDETPAQIPQEPALTNLPPEDEFGPQSKPPAPPKAPSGFEPEDQVPRPFLRGEDAGKRNSLSLGDICDLTRGNQSLANIRISAGWEQAAIEEDKIDMDLSMFFLDRNGKTRVDEDFVFYNNPEIHDGAIKHLGDSRTGAGEGDDEAIHVQLTKIPFDALKIIFVLSIYDDQFLGHNFSMVRDVFIRISDEDNDREIFHYPLDEEHLGNNITAIQVGHMFREGTKWMFETQAETATGGLAKIATDYGMVVKEMQSVDLNEDADEKV